MGFLAINLRRAMTFGVVTLALMAIIASGGLVGLTALVHSSGRQASAALESVRLVEEVQRDLLLHDRVDDAMARTQIAQGLRDRVGAMSAHVDSAEERRILGRASRSVSTYLDADLEPTNRESLPAKHAEAFSAVASVLTQELNDVQNSRATVKRYDDLGDIIGTVTAMVVIITAAVVVWWLRTRALRPLLGLSRSMRRFGGGDLDARATVEGPAELADMARRFNDMASSIARQRKERQTFIAGVVHDLRNPLAVLRMSTELVGSDGSKVSPEKMAKVLGAVGRQVGRLDRMVADLLDSVAIETGNVRLRLQEHDARQIAIETAELYRASSTSHQIELQLPADPVPLMCDGMRVEQVLSNLLSNAIKYSPAGGRISLALDATKEGVTFAVRDEGVGMTPSDAEKAFEPFRRSAKTRDQVPGSGLGLFVVRRLVEAHGGRVSVRTAPAAGSTFEVRIPAAAHC